MRDLQTDRQADIQTGRQIHRHRDRIQADNYSYRQTQTVKQAERQAGIQLLKIGRQIKEDNYTDRYTDRKTDTCTQIHIHIDLSSCSLFHLFNFNSLLVLFSNSFPVL